MPTRQYRNDSDTSYDIPGLGLIHAGQRVSFSGEFPPPINLENYPGLVDVLAEEESGVARDYEANPEVVTDTTVDPAVSAISEVIQEAINEPPESQGDPQNG